MKVAALFSGAGGLDLGFKNSGFDVIWANEYDKIIWETFEKNHPDTFLDRRSIIDIPNDDLPKNIDGLIGGPPCQSWSLAGSMRGINDDRGKLFYEYIRVLNYIKPKFFLVENVKGIVSKAHLSSFSHIIELFEESGYNCHYKVLNAVDFNVPQTRERVFIIGFRKDLNVNFKFPKSMREKRTLEDVLKGLEDAVPSGTKSTNTIHNNEYMTGSFSTIFMSRNRIREYNQPSFTIQASGRHAPLHPSSPKMIKVEKDKFIFDGPETKVRRLSVRECARIQTFPDDFVFYYKNINNGYKMIGNAVPVKLSEAIAKSINTAINYEVSEYIKKPLAEVLNDSKMEEDLCIFNSLQKSCNF